MTDGRALRTRDTKDDAVGSLEHERAKALVEHARGLDRQLRKSFRERRDDAFERQRLLNCGALRALCRPAFLRSTWRASRVRKPARFNGMRRFGSASTSARLIP